MKKNYFLRTAILLVALLCGAVSGWAVSITQAVTFIDWSKVTGSGTSYAPYQGDQTLPGSDGIDYTWNFTSVMPKNGSTTATELQMKKSNGILVSPVFETEYGFTVTITYSCSKNDASITETGTSNTIKGESPLSLTVSSLSAGITINAGSAATYISQIEIEPINPALQDPALAFTYITGDITKQLSDGSYSSVATTVSDASIVYSSSDQEVATIDQTGLVTLVAGGTTVIKAEVAETATFNAASIQYTLTVVDLANIKTFTKVTNGAVTDGKYIIVYQASDDATSVMAMNTTNTKNYFLHTVVNLTSGTIITEDESIIWNITTESDGNYSIYNSGIYAAFNGSTSTSGNNNAYADSEYTTERAGWKIEYDSEKNVFLFKNAAVETRLLQFNANSGSERFACYRSSQKNLTLYKLDEGKTAVKVTFDEVSGNKDIFFAEGLTYNSAATATPERPITYSSSNQEVATIDPSGLVTVVGPGTTIIKAVTEADDTYQEGAAQYILTVRATTVTLPYSIDFKTSLGDWLTYTTVGTAQWESTQYGAQINGYNKGATEAYLISPNIDAANISFSFTNEKAYSGNDLQLFYSTDFDPNTMQPTDVTWNEITNMAIWSTSGATESGEIELTELTAPIRLAFKYTCSDDAAARWTIPTLSIEVLTPKVELTFNEVSGDKTLVFTEGFTYNSAATVTPERAITYSSENQEVATIDENGMVALVGTGTTVISAATEADENYPAASIQYTLTVIEASATLPHEIDFRQGLGNWLSITTTGTAMWESTQYGAQINGYNKGKTEAYLISPEVNNASIILSFTSLKGFSGNDVQLFYSTDYAPNTMNPLAASWTEITEMATWSTSEHTESGDIELKNLTAPIRFAFKYTCEENLAASWGISDLTIKAGTSTGIENAVANGMKIINGKGQVTIETAEAASVAVYALTGAQVRHIELVEGTNVVELPAGIYLINNQKVVVF
ncbi:MAG TPA: Ig-like domain-containing protein [Candidatus Barnesiella excrementigallinarum]|nr:Ig-like domain-containing protein [Candidatus Barnesiella excrementigallinarum]